MAEPTWISTSALHPKDGQTVLAKSRYMIAPQTVTFRSHPTPRWEDKETIYGFKFFDRWALVPSDASS
jgi:hypothetical protein